MTESFAGLAGIAVPFFVVLTMLNVGLTQKPSEILSYWREWPFVLRMLLANFVLAPLVMVLALRLIGLDPALEAGLLLFALCAGAPFLVKLTQVSGHDVALGAATMLLLMLATVLYVPVALPLLLEGVSADAWPIARALLSQLVLPIVVGMVLARLLPDLMARVQPWVARLPAMQRLEAQGMSFDRQYCTVPICTPPRARRCGRGSMRSTRGSGTTPTSPGSGELSHDVPTIGHLLREQGYDTAFKGKWHLSEVPRDEDGLESYGFSDYQQ